MAKLPSRPRFSLRSLLVFVTVAAVCMWSFWHGWPLWQTFQFESVSKELRPGMSYSDVSEILGRGGHRKVVMAGPDALTVRVEVHRVASQLYGIALFYPSRVTANRPSIAIKVFRFDALANKRTTADQCEWHGRFRGIYERVEGHKLGEFAVVHSEPKEALQSQ